MKPKKEEKVEEVKALQVAPQNSPAAMIRDVLMKNGNISDLKELLQIQKDWEANEARKAFNQAMSDFKENPIEILKDKTVAYEKVRYNHASLYNVVEKITASLSKHGLSVSWRTNQAEKISVTTRISHTLGHFEETVLTAEPDKSGSKNSIQAIGSTITYLQRYGLLAITGLATKDQDDDAKGAEIQTITEEQAVKIEEFLITLKTKIDRNKFLNKYGIKEVLELPKSKYAEVISLFKATEARRD